MINVNLLVVILILIIYYVEKKESFISGYFPGEESDPKLANLIQTNDEKIVYSSDPFAINQTINQQTKKVDPMICLYNGQNMVSNMYGVNNNSSPPHTTKKDILEMFDQMQGPVDLAMANKMAATSKHAKQSFINRSRFTRRAFDKYFVEELEESSNRRWWDDDELDMEM